MNRSSRFISGVGASYIGLGANIAYSLAIVPIGLYYLGKDQFGLWMLLVQIATYLSFIELGIFGASARILIDYQDDKNGSAYAQVVTTAWAVLVVQAAIMAVASWLLAPLIVAAFNIPPPLHDIAISLFVFLGLSTALATCFKVFSAILYANQRIDLVVLLTALQLILGLVVVWPLLSAGYGLPAVIWSFILPVSATSILSWIACWRLRLLPTPMLLTDLSISKFRELFKFGTDLFLVNVGIQLLEASQLMIVSRTMGLAAAATWSVSTKLFTLLFQMTAKVENTAVVFFSEMIVRGERDVLQLRFRQMYQFTGSVAVCSMLGAVALNPFFVTVWAGPDVLWPSINNWLIAALLILNLLLRCHTDFAMHTKQVGLFRFLFFFESLAFVGVALWAAPRFGFAGVLTSSIVCAVVFRSAYSISRTASYFSLPYFSVAFRWIGFLLLPVLAMGSVAIAVPLLSERLVSPIFRAAVAGVTVLVAIAVTMYTIGLPSNVRQVFHEKIHEFYFMALAALRK